MDNNSRKREFTRVAARFSVTIITEDRTVRCGRVQDVSMNGLFLLCDERLPVGADCRISLLLEGAESRPCIEMRGTVVRAAGAGVAVQFTEIEAESYDHLRNLVLHNASDTTQVEQEIVSHLGLKPRPQ